MKNGIVVLMVCFGLIGLSIVSLAQQPSSEPTAKTAIAAIPDAPVPQLSSDSATQTTTKALANSSIPSPVKKKRLHLDGVDWFLFSVGTTARIVDVYSTRRAAKCTCNSEDDLPGFITNNTATMSLYSATIIAGTFYLTDELEKHHHQWLAKIPQIVNISFDIGPAFNNLHLPTTPPVNHSILQ